MNTHEFQAKEILQKYGVPTPPFMVLFELDDLSKGLEKLGISTEAVIKVQVHAGGRGKAGGVKLARSRKEIEEAAKALLKMKIINEQTGKEGVVAHQILISPLVDYKKEYYLGAIIDRKQAQAVLIASPEGGVEIEEVALKTPEKIATYPIGLNGKVRPFHLLQLAKFMGWKGVAFEEGKKVATALAKAFIETDASLLEINPLVETASGHIIALDAKLAIDENALFRHKDLEELYDETQLLPTEVLAHKTSCLCGPRC